MTQPSQVNSLIVIDDFLDHPGRVRKHALLSEFIDWDAPDGETYKRICITPVPGMIDKIEEVVGPIEVLGTGYRLNFNKENPNNAIHSDLGWGTHALVLYLSEGPGGTAFWTHNKTQTTNIFAGQLDLLEEIKDDWNDVSKWKMRYLSEMRFNRAIIYESSLFHSRWPFQAFGTTEETGRLIAVAFFNLRKDDDSPSDS